MIVREAVANAGSHGCPSAIDISAQHVGNQLLFRVTDNGTGFDVKSASTPSDDHYGILGMHERAEMIGAHLEITSNEGVGTCISISIKLSPK